MRLLWDGRGGNRAIESDSFLMPRVEDLIDRIARCKFEAQRAGYTNMIFSGLYQRTSFWQLSLDEASRPLTAFSTSVGQYQWRCLSSTDMYNNDVGQESAQKFMKQTGDLKAATLYFAS